MVRSIVSLKSGKFGIYSTIVDAIIIKADNLEELKKVFYKKRLREFNNEFEKTWEFYVSRIK